MEERARLLAFANLNRLLVNNTGFHVADLNQLSENGWIWRTAMFPNNEGGAVPAN